MEYTGKESYGGTVDDGGRREMTVIEKADLVIKIVRILERYSDRQGWSQVLHHAFFKNVAIEIAQAIEALTPKGDENGLLTVIGILEDLIANFTLHEDKRGLYVQSSAQAIDDLYKGEGQERVRAMLNQMDKCTCFSEMKYDIAHFKKREGL